MTDNRMSREALERALADAPGYASWRAFDPGPDAPLDARYAALPTLTKADLRAGFPRDFIPDGRDLDTALADGAVEIASTSGSTDDDQVAIVFHADWWEASEAAAWQLNAHARRVANGAHPEAVLASPRCVGPGHTDRTLSPEARTLGRHLYLNQKINPATWSRADVRQMARELNDHAPVVLEADPAYLAAFARCIADCNLTIHQPELIFLTYSYPSRVYKRLIGEVFTAPMASSYGSTETGHVFMECEAGRLHQNVAHCRVDVQPWRPCHGGPRLARMLVTVFHNPWFVVLRFDIGDVARLDDRGPCPCGRTQGLTLASIDGRTSDVTFTPEGRAVTVDRIDAGLAEIPGLNGWQLDMPEPARLRLRILAEAGREPSAGRLAREVLTAIYGARMDVEVAAEPALVHEASGKFRFARSAFPVDYSRLWQEHGGEGIKEDTDANAGTD